MVYGLKCSPEMDAGTKIMCRAGHLLYHLNIICIMVAGRISTFIFKSPRIITIFIKMENQ